MRLLVSVRSGREVASALAGGADIIDAKEPSLGSLGAVDAGMLSEIASAVPAEQPLSVALGDLGGPTEAEAVLTALRLGEIRVAYLKAGFAGVADESDVQRVIAGLVRAASGLPSRPRVVAVAYADHRVAGSLNPARITALAASAGAEGVLLDTWTKDGRDLFAWVSPLTLKEWVTDVRGLGLLSALAGSLRPDSIPTALHARPDIIGVRGAACDDGRAGSVSASRVRALKAAMDLSTSIAVAVT